MMVRGLVDEVVRRRLWPIPLIALLIAIAAPLLFMKSGPAVPGADAAPPAAAPGKLPAKAEKLLVTTDKGVVVVSKKKLKRKDPFAPPKSATSSSSSSASVTQKNTTIAVATAPPSVTSATGAAPPPPPPPPPPSTGSTSTSSGSTGETSTSSPNVTTTKPTSEPKTTTPKSTSTQTVTYVDVRFGPRAGTMLRYRIPHMQTFSAGGMVAAMYVGYSRARKVAVFAIAPTTTVTGDVKCRTVDHVCRFVDLAPDSYARLTLHGEDGAVSRRLDLVSVRRVAEAGRAKTAPLATTRPAAKCLMKRLLALPATAPSISTDSCD